MTLFGMMAAPGSEEHTPGALASFFAHTRLTPDDRLVLIDGGGAPVLPDGVPSECLSVIRPETAETFAQRANRLLTDARTRQADLVLLSNRVTFTDGWFEPLKQERRSLLSADLAAGDAQPAARDGYSAASAVPLACARIPRAVYEAVGTFDETLDDDTAAERDYAIRTWIAGIPQEIARGARVEYAQVSSRGASAAATAAFEKKWGASLTHGFITGDWSVFRSNARLAEQIQSGQFTPVVRYLRSHRALDAFQEAPRQAANPVAAYLNLLESTLLGTIYEDPPMDNWSGTEFDARRRHVGRDWPSQAHTMIGRLRMRQLRTAVLTVLRDNVPGDFIETGVWRGGACVYMAGILRASGQQGRTVWVADSFAGLPPPDPDRFPADAGDKHHTVTELAISLEQVRETFARYDLLDDNVAFLKGWFSETLPTAPIERLAVLRLDGDMYGSTWDAIEALYPKLSPGGFCIVDDYGAVEGCKKAIHDYRERHGITEPIIDIDGWGVYWRRAA